MSTTRLRRFPPLQTFALTLILLTPLGACASKPEVISPKLPEPTADLQDCVQEAVPDIPGAQGTPLTNLQATDALGQQRVSALSKARCANNYNAWYVALRAGLTK